MQRPTSMRGGALAAVLAYILWGILPVYWKALKAVPSLEILAHRTVWSLLCVLLLLAVRRQWAWLQKPRRDPRLLLRFLASACLLGGNWLTYIWAVNSGHVVDSSLGYFINPLLSVFLGMLFLGERLRRWQGLAIGLALAGVLFLTVAYGAFPWIAFTLAGTFGVYGLLRKTASLGSLEGLALETALLSLPTLAYLILLQSDGTGAFVHAGPETSLLLIGAGVVTAFPLLLFGYAARNVTLATVGILQYIAPTLQFLLGVLVYAEPFSQTRLIGFAVIWLALAIYSAEGLILERKRRAVLHHRP
jgi:chloramphenicol-sensitive protein RarD